MMSLLFSDDTNLFVTDKDVIKLEEAEIDLNRIASCLKINKPSGNIKNALHGIQ